MNLFNQAGKLEYAPRDSHYNSGLELSDDIDSGINEAVDHFMVYVHNEYDEPCPPLTLAELFWDKYCSGQLCFRFFPSYTAALETFSVIVELFISGQLRPTYCIEVSSGEYKDVYYPISGIIRPLSSNGSWKTTTYLFDQNRWDWDKAYANWTIGHDVMHSGIANISNDMQERYEC